MHARVRARLAALPGCYRLDWITPRGTPDRGYYPAALQLVLTDSGLVPTPAPSGDSASLFWGMHPFRRAHLASENRVRWLAEGPDSSGFTGPPEPWPPAWAKDSLGPDTLLLDFGNGLGGTGITLNLPAFSELRDLRDPVLVLHGQVGTGGDVRGVPPCMRSVRAARMTCATRVARRPAGGLKGFAYRALIGRLEGGC